MRRSMRRKGKQMERDRGMLSIPYSRRHFEDDSLDREGKTRALSGLGLGRLLPRSILQQRGVAFFGGQLDVADDGAANEAVFDGEHVRILFRIRHRNVRQLDVEILVYRVKRPVDGQVVLQLHHHVLAHEGLEKRSRSGGKG